MGICFSSQFSDENHYHHHHHPPPPPATTAKVISINGQLREYRLPVLASQVLVQEEDQEEQEAASSSTPYSITSSPSTSTSTWKSSSSSPWILCDADLLTYEDYIPVMDSHSPLSPDHIYYVLHTSRLHRRLSPSDMAALAVKAALALQNHSSKSNSKPKAKQQNNINHNKRHSAESRGLLRRRPLRQSRNARVSPAVVVPLPAVLDNHRPSSRSSSSNTTPYRHQATSGKYDYYYYYEILNNNSIKVFDHLHHQPKPQPYPQRQAPRRLSAGSGSLRTRTSVQKYASGSRQTKFTAIRSFRLRLSTIYEGSIL